MKNLRANADADTPVLFATQMDDEKNIVEALEAGADDYMVKPIRKLELFARINALSRRTSSTELQDTITVGTYHFDPNDRKISVDGPALELTGKEYDLAAFLFKNIGKVVSRNHILESIWGFQDANLSTRTVDVHISRLRKKLSLSEENGLMLRSIYQHGYRLEKAGDQA